jgi:arabinoxylan arabinofuranohydrolase
MYKKLFMSVVVMATCITTNGQKAATDYKGSDNNNPISANVFCADPTALEYNGRLYVYGSNDHQEFLANGKKGDNSYGNIKSIVVFSTDDMVNWTFHGTIDTKKLCSGWQPSVWYKGYGVSWAPSVTWRHNEETDVDEFFLYFCNSSHGVGVLRAESPIGPWKSPNKELMITYDTPGANAAGTNANFDPGVTIDDNGVGWISFGGLGPSTMMPEAARIIKLKPNMTEVDGSAVKIHAPYHFEANELNVIGGKYVYTYCSNWADRSETASEWKTYKSEHGITTSAPDACTMCYMVSDNPSDPDSWVYKGVYGPHPGNGTNNNHSHLQKFQGSYYHIYHNAVLKETLKAAGAIDGSAGIYRSLCVNKVSVNESTATISQSSTSLTGVTQIKNLNPYELQQMETMASCGGVEYEDITNIKRNTKINTLGNDASENMQVKMKAGSWINVRKVDFGKTGADRLVLRAKGTGKIAIRFSSSANPKNIIATFEFSSTDFEDHVLEIPVGKLTKFKGVNNNLYFIVTEGEDVYVDSWKFLETGSTAIQELSNSKWSNRQLYDLSGRRLSGAQQHRGIVIEQYTDENGVKHSRKVVSGKE